MNQYDNNKAKIMNVYSCLCSSLRLLHSYKSPHQGLLIEAISDPSMGGIFSRRQQSQAEAASPKEAYSKSKNTQWSMSIIELLKPECLKTKKTKRKRSKLQQSLNQPEKKITKARKLTLEE